jgi:hypothetical protein
MSQTNFGDKGVEQSVYVLWVLDTCLDATDPVLVAAAYKWRQQKGLLKVVGKVNLAGKSGVMSHPNLVKTAGNRRCARWLSCGV